jgi:hypothetical protein
MEDSKSKLRELELQQGPCVQCISNMKFTKYEAKECAELGNRQHLDPYCADVKAYLAEFDEFDDWQKQALKCCDWTIGANKPDCKWQWAADSKLESCNARCSRTAPEGFCEEDDEAGLCNCQGGKSNMCRKDCERHACTSMEEDYQRDLGYIFKNENGKWERELEGVNIFSFLQESADEVDSQDNLKEVQAQVLRHAHEKCEPLLFGGAFCTCEKGVCAQGQAKNPMRSKLGNIHHIPNKGVEFRPRQTCFDINNAIAKSPKEKQKTMCEDNPENHGKYMYPQDCKVS